MQKSNIIRKFIGDKTHYVEKKEKELVVATISDPSYTTNGENIILVKGVDNCELILNQDTTTHIIIKSLTNTLLKTNSGLIDEYYEEILMKKGACVELIVIGNNWYVLSSDGLKLD
jgi:hypothetical protein